MKQKSLAKLVDEVAVLLQKLVRLKAADGSGYASCVTCKGVFHWKEMDGGHFISRNHTATKILEENIHPQCKGCNGFRMKDSLVVMDYEDYMKEMYGPEFVEELKILAKRPMKHDRAYLEQKKREYSAQIRQLEMEKAA